MSYLLTYSLTDNLKARDASASKKLASLKATLVGIYDPVSESAGHRVKGS